MREGRGGRREPSRELLNAAAADGVVESAQMSGKAIMRCGKQTPEGGGVEKKRPKNPTAGKMSSREWWRGRLQSFLQRKKDSVCQIITVLRKFQSWRRKMKRNKESQVRKAKQ